MKDKSVYNRNRFIPVRRTAMDGKNWWVAFDLERNDYSVLLCHGRYKTKRACQFAIDWNSERH